MRGGGGLETRNECHENEKREKLEMTTKMIWYLSSRQLCNTTQKVELTKKRVEKSSCWTKKMA